MEGLKMLETTLLNAVTTMNGYIWGNFAVYFLIGAGIFYTLKRMSA